MHPYPTTAQLRAEAQAETALVADLLGLRAMQGCLERCLADIRASLPDLSGPHHPDCRYQFGDTIDALADQLRDVQGELARLRNAPIVIED